MTYRRSGSGGTYANQNDVRPATTAHAGLMPKLGAATAGLGGFVVTGGGGSGSTINTDLATASVAGALAAADFDKLHNWPKLRLGYVAAADLANGLAVAANTQTDIVPNQSFTVNATTGILLVEVRLGLLAVAGAGGLEGQVRAILDAAGTPVTVKLGGFAGNAAANIAINGGAYWDTGRAAGTHTIKIAIYSSGALTAYCRALSQAVFEHAAITIYEVQP